MLQIVQNKIIIDIGLIKNDLFFSHAGFFILKEALNVTNPPFISKSVTILKI